MVTVMGKRSKEKQRDRRRCQKRKKCNKIKTTGSQLSSVTPEVLLAGTSLNAQCANPDRHVDEFAADSPSVRGPGSYSPLFGSDSSPSSPPSSPTSSCFQPSRCRSPPPSSPFESELPIVVVDKKRKLEVHISDPEYESLPGAEVLKLNAEEYFRQVEDQKRKTTMTIKCLRNKVEKLEKELLTKEESLRIEKQESVSRVREFWRNLIEGNTHGGKMVRAARHGNNIH